MRKEKIFHRLIPTPNGHSTPTSPVLQLPYANCPCASSFNIHSSRNVTRIPMKCLTLLLLGTEVQDTSHVVVVKCVLKFDTPLQEVSTHAPHLDCDQ